VKVKIQIPNKQIVSIAVSIGSGKILVIIAPISDPITPIGYSIIAKSYSTSTPAGLP
jgi:hypothetical protein